MARVPPFGFCVNLLSILFNLITTGFQGMGKILIYGNTGYWGILHYPCTRYWESYQNGHMIKILFPSSTSPPGIRNGSSIGWRTIHPPEHLEAVKNFLFTTLQGKTPINKSSKDILGWGKNGNYTVKEGYKKLSFDSSAAGSIWKKVWQSDCIPKVNSFI